MIYYKLNSFFKKKMFNPFIKNNILATIFYAYFDVWAVDLDRSSIVRKIKILFVMLKEKKLYLVSY